MTDNIFIQNKVREINAVLQKDRPNDLFNEDATGWNISTTVEFSHLVSELLKEILPDCRVIPQKLLCSACGVIVKDGKYVRYTFRDFRLGDWRSRIRIRVVPDDEDFGHDFDHHTDLNSLREDVMRLLR